MGLFASRWEANWEGHTLTVTRNEWTKGYRLTCDGTQIDRKWWSPLGIGALQGELTHHGNQLTVRAVLTSTCEIHVAGVAIPVKAIR